MMRRILKNLLKVFVVLLVVFLVGYCFYVFRALGGAAV